MNAGIRRALLRAEPGSDRFLAFEDPLETLVAREPREVPRLLEQVEQAALRGLWVVGFVGYEAAPAFDAALVAHPPRSGPTPLAAFSIFREPTAAPLPRAGGAPRGAPSRPAPLADVRAGLDPERFKTSIEGIRQAIAEGSTYQVNLSFPFYGSLSSLSSDELGAVLLAELAGPGEAPYAAWMEGEGWAVLSLSPELFFERRPAAGESSGSSSGRVVSRPMKGTRPRGRYPAEDFARAAELAGSEKDRAENLMIVDLVRNDLGRIARAGSVVVEEQLAVERYPTVWQMTSTVAAESDATLPEIFAALFPCASVTGAPKPATTRFIRDLEAEARGVYCGAIGRVEPEGAARFAVAIRTLEIDLGERSFRYGVGCGVTWDSDPEEEWRECLAKARVLEGAPPEFDLFETMRWRPGCGIALLARHLARLAASAEYFGFAAGEAEDEGQDRDQDKTFLFKTGKEETKTKTKASIEGEAGAVVAPSAVGLAELAGSVVVARCALLPSRSHRVRLRLSRAGRLSVEADPFVPDRAAWRVAVSDLVFPSMEVFAFHKTSLRERYELALARARQGAQSELDEVLLVNERGELTEGTRTNLMVQFTGDLWVTPPLDAGLLPGVYREHLLATGRAIEATLFPADLRRAHRIRLVNALRGWIPVVMV